MDGVIVFLYISGFIYHKMVFSHVFMDRSTFMDNSAWVFRYFWLQIAVPYTKCRETTGVLGQIDATYLITCPCVPGIPILYVNIDCQASSGRVPSAI